MATSVPPGEGVKRRARVRVRARRGWLTAVAAAGGAHGLDVDRQLDAHLDAADDEDAHRRGAGEQAELARLAGTADEQLHLMPLPLPLVLLLLLVFPYSRVVVHADRTAAATHFLLSLLHLPALGAVVVVGGRHFNLRRRRRRRRHRHYHGRHHAVDSRRRAAAVCGERRIVRLSPDVVT